jgi:hypothetical protein
MDPVRRLPEPAPEVARIAVARTVVAAAVAVVVACVAVVGTAPPSTGLVVVALCLPAAAGVLLLWRASLYTWRRGAARPRAFVIDEGRAFLLLPDRATMRAVAFVLMCTFPLGYPVVAAREDDVGLLTGAALGVAAVVVPVAVLHAVFLVRGVPRPLVEITPGGVTVRGFFGSVHAAWDVFEDRVIVPDRGLQLALPVYTRPVLRRRGPRPYGVHLPARREPFHDPLEIPATWATNPWWAGQALAFYLRRPHHRGKIGTSAGHDGLAGSLRPYEHEIDDQLSRYR